MTNGCIIESASHAREPVLLIVEDDGQVARVLSRIAGKAFSTRVTRTLTEARAVIGEAPLLAGLVLDIRLPDGSGLELLPYLKSQGVTCRVLVLTGYMRAENIAEAQLYGAEFLTKPFATTQVLAFVDRLRAAVPSRDRWERLDNAARQVNLTKREKEIVALYLLDRSRVAMAAELGISLNTVKMHVRAILRKTGDERLSALAQRLL